MVAQRALGAGVRLPGLARLRLAPDLFDPREFGLEAGELGVALGLVAFGLGGVVADDEAARAVAFTEADVLDAQVVTDGLVAAGARERRLGIRRAVAHPLAGDPVAAATGQVAQVVVGGEAAVDDPDATAEPPAAQVVLDLGDPRLV